MVTTLYHANDKLYYRWDKFMMKLPYCLPEIPLLIKYTAEFSPNYCNCSKS